MRSKWNNVEKLQLQMTKTNENRLFVSQMQKFACVVVVVIGAQFSSQQTLVLWCAN